MNTDDYLKALELAERLNTSPAHVLNNFSSFMAEFSTPEWDGDYCEEGCDNPESACLLCVEGNDYRGYWG